MRLSLKLIRLRFFLIAVVLALSAFFGRAFLSLGVDPSNQSMFVKEDPDYVFYRAFNERYGSDELIVLALQTKDFFAVPHLRVLKEMTDRLRGLRHVEKVLSLSDVINIVPSGFFGAGIKPLMEGVLEGKKSMEAFKREVFANELYAENLISKDGKTAAIIVRVARVEGDLEYQKVLIGKLRGLMNEYRGSGIRFYMAGIPVEQYEFIDFIQRDQRLFVPLVVLLVACVCLLLYQSWVGIAIPMTVVLLTLVWTLGTIALSGNKLNLVTSLLGPVIMIVSVTNAIHIMNYYRTCRRQHPRSPRAIAKTMSAMHGPGRYTIPRSKRMLRLYFQKMEEASHPDLWDIVSRDFTETIMVLRIKSIGTRRGNEIRRAVERYIEDHLPPDLQVRLTGNILLLSKLSTMLVSGQIKSLGLASLLIFLFMTVLFRSFRLGFAAFLPNAVPIIMTFGVMGFAKIDLSNVTAMISSVVLGLIVDNTIYFVSHYVREFKLRHDYEESLDQTYREVGKSVVASVMILTMGFSIGLLGSFKPTIYFAALAGLTIFLSLLAVLFLLPALLLALRPLGYPAPHLVRLHVEGSKSSLRVD